MFTPKPISREGLDAALAKAERYRLLNEPGEAESISLDILAVDATNQRALTILLLAITDLFARELGANVARAKAVVPRLDGEYAQAYYTGIIAERRAKAIFQRGGMGSGHMAYEGLRDAMRHYETAERLRQPGYDDPILRWNACARLIDARPELHAAEHGEMEHMLE